MSRIFDALRKSEKNLEEQLSVTPDSFIDTMERAHAGLEAVPTETARLRSENRLIVYSDSHSLGAERFRLLRTRLNHWQAAKKLKSLLITSALPEDGKSVVAANLAAVLASQEGRKVLLLEGDLRRSGLCPLLGIKPGPGLAGCLRNSSDGLSAVRRVNPLKFYLLPAGESCPNPVELLQSERFRELTQNLSSYFDWILIDSPPVSPLADTPVLKNYADATLLVVRGGVTPKDALEEAMQLLGADHILGIVLNQAEGVERTYYQHYAYRAKKPSREKTKNNRKKPSE